MPKILVVDDVYTVRLKTDLVLRKAGAFTVVLAGSGAEALTVALHEVPDAMVLDFVMPDMDGPTTLRTLRAHAVPCPAVLYTARPEQYPGEAIVLGFDAYVSKAAGLDQLIAAVRQMLAGRPAPAIGGATRFASGCDAAGANAIRQTRP
ncbi:MAG: response regulator transcription factor [Chloroflexaceae bacterium]